MADEAFALSPISARGASPTETDYDAIREAFMETARGRWFLGEYAKRNRNSDTTIVLDAVARLEQMVALQKQAPPPAIDGMSDAVDAIIQIIDTARDSVEAALGSSFLEEALAPSRKSARIIQEIAWSLRESGADSRISNILDGQVEAIHVGCERLAAFNVRDDVLTILDSARARIEELAGPRNRRPETSATETPSHRPNPIEAASATEGYAQPQARESPGDVTPPHAGVDKSEPVPAIATAMDMDMESAVKSERAIVSGNAIAPESATEAESPFEAAIARTHLEPAVSQRIVSQSPIVQEPIAQRPIMPPSMSIGESLIARGIVAKPAAHKPDPLAPFQRMTQAEKIAFFS